MGRDDWSRWNFLTLLAIVAGAIGGTMLGSYNFALWLMVMAVLIAGAAGIRAVRRHR
jgi:hypothetical protein